MQISWRTFELPKKGILDSVESLTGKFLNYNRLESAAQESQRIQKDFWLFQASEAFYISPKNLLVKILIASRAILSIYSSRHLKNNCIDFIEDQFLDSGLCIFSMKAFIKYW